jgi:HPr kinase/phosphorylase
MTAATPSSAGSVHGVAVLIGEIGVLITGPSGSGKSSLALALPHFWPSDPVRLVADDRVLIARAGKSLTARPVPGFEGLIEVRGIGMATAPSMPSCVLRCVVALQGEDPERMPETIETTDLSGVALPLLRLHAGMHAAAAFITKWPYFRAVLMR